MQRRLRTSVMIRKTAVFTVIFVLSGIVAGQQISSDGEHSLYRPALQTAVHAQADQPDSDLFSAPAQDEMPDTDLFGTVSQDEAPDPEPLDEQLTLSGELMDADKPVYRAPAETQKSNNAAEPDGFRYHPEIPLSPEIQEYAYRRCTELALDYPTVLALMWRESRFTPNAVNTNTNGTRDSGLMQINDTNRSWLKKEMGITDLMDPYQNIQAGTEMLSRFTKKHGSHNALMAYQFGEQGMRLQLEQGVTTTRQIEQLYSKREEFAQLLAQAESHEKDTPQTGENE